MRKQQEANEEYYYYEEDEDSSGDSVEYYDEDEEVQCRLCDGEEEERPRLFWNFMDITRRVPCCEDEDTRQAETTTMPSGPRFEYLKSDLAFSNITMRNKSHLPIIG